MVSREKNNIISASGLQCVFLPVAPLQSDKKSAHTKNSGDSRESNQVKINQVLCCILMISRFYIGQADVTVNLGGSQISMPKNRCHILYVHPSVQQVGGRQLHSQHILYQNCRLFIYPPSYGIHYLLYNACPDIHTIHLQKISCKPCDDMLP